jgi:hypothetical protein
MSSAGVSGGKWPRTGWCPHSIASTQTTHKTLLSTVLLFSGVYSFASIHEGTVLWDVALCGSCQNKHFRGTYHLYLLGGKNPQARNNINSLLATVNVVPRSWILSALRKELTYSSKTSVVTRATRHHIPEDCILPSRRHENVKSYIALADWTL